MRYLTFLALVSGLLLAGCATLPQGSYVEARTGFSKDSGVSGKAVVHIPLR